MREKHLKANKGISMTDIVVAISILMLFVGVIGNLYYQVALQSNMIRLNTIAVYYSIKIAENIDRITYDNVTNELNNNNTLKDTCKIEIIDPFKVTINVENYNKDDSSKKDIIKIVTIRVEYQFFQETRAYELKKLKIKEQ